MNIVIENYNCGYGKTLMLFIGFHALEHAADYLYARGGNEYWDRPYLPSWDAACKYLRTKLEAGEKEFYINFCMGGGSIPDYEHMVVKFTEHDFTSPGEI